MANVSQWDVSAANNNDTPPDGWPENMARSSVNDSARENMAGIARWYQDTNGTLTSGGTAAAITLTTNNSHAALADQSIISFVAANSASANATLNVDSLGAKQLRTFDGGDAAGLVVANQLVVVVYNATDDVYNVISGGGDAVGTVKMTVDDAAPVGWLVLNGDTLGNASSGATHAGAQFEVLYTLFWNSMADSEAAVSTGRGASAAIDFAANKTLTMPDARGRALIGTGTGSGLTARTHGDATIGAEDAIVVAHTHDPGTLAADSGGAHTHTATTRQSSGGGLNQPTGADTGGSGTMTTDSGGSHAHTISGATASTGSSATDANIPPSLALNIIVKY